MIIDDKSRAIVIMWNNIKPQRGINPTTVNRPRCRFIIKEQELSYSFRPLVWHLTNLITLP